jgi:hypothetical protein
MYNSTSQDLPDWLKNDSILRKIYKNSFLNYLLANYAFLNFDLLSVRSLNFPKISASFLTAQFFIIGEVEII